MRTANVTIKPALKNRISQILETLPADFTNWKPSTQYCTNDYDLIAFQYNTGNLLLRLKFDNKSYLIKTSKENQEQNQRLLQEINWYDFNSGNEKLSGHLPMYYGRMQTGGRHVLILEYIPNMITIADYLLKDNFCKYPFPITMTKLFEIFDLRIVTACGNDVSIFAKYIAKHINNRYNELLWRLQSDTEYLHLAERKIKVNELHSVSLNEIRNYLIHVPEIIMKQKYTVVGTIHGDLHLGNILINRDEFLNFYLVDPNLINGMMPLYDLAKLYQSLYGLYDLIKAGLFTLDSQNLENMSFAFNENAYNLYGELRIAFTNSLNDSLSIMDKDETLSELMKKMVLMHFFCLLPHHYKNRNNFLALLARTIHLFYETI